jgi:ADP-heptose:LPS heptosyltransferase
MIKKNEAIKFSTLILRVKRKMREAIHKDIVSLRFNSGFPYSEAIYLMAERLLEILPHDKSCPQTEKKLVIEFLKSSKFEIWRNKLKCKLIQLYPEASSNEEAKIPFEILKELIQNSVLTGLENNDTHVLYDIRLKC